MRYNVMAELTNGITRLASVNAASEKDAMRACRVIAVPGQTSWRVINESRRVASLIISRGEDAPEQMERSM